MFDSFIKAVCWVRLYQAWLGATQARAHISQAAVNFLRATHC